MYTGLMWVVFRILLLIALYVVASYGAWSVAIPPYFVSVFWPAAGVALAFSYMYGARILPGVFIGAFASVLLSPIGHTFDVNGTIFACGIASGATLQAFVGAHFIRKVLGQDTEFRGLRSIVLFSAIGVMSCFVAATSALTLFLFTERIEVSDALGFWEPWFVGDVLGVLLMAPLVLLVLSKNAITLHRRLAVIIPVTLLFIVLIVVFFNVKSKDFEARQDRFKANVELVKREMDSRFDAYYSEMSALQSFYKASTFVDRQEFTTFVQYMVDGRAGFHALVWNPQVTNENRAAFLEEARAVYGDSFSIKDISGDKQLGFEDNDYNMPVYYISPEEKMDAVLGADLWSSEVRRQALKRTRDQNVIAATEPLPLLDVGGEGDLGFIITAPIYDRASFKIDDPSSYKASFKGAVIGALQYSVVVDEVIDVWRDRGIELILKANSGNDGLVVYQSQNGIHEDAFVEGFVVEVPYVFGGQQWVFCYYMNPVFYNENLNFNVWYALIAGLIFLSFTSIFLMALTGQSSVMEDLVEEKTAELSHKNKFLNIVMDTVPDMIFVKDEQFKIIQGNQSFFNKVAPDKRGGIIGTTGLEHFPEEEQEIYLANDKKALEKGMSETQENITDYKGETRILETRKQRFTDENNQAFILGYARDVTDLLNTQTKLETILDTTADGLMTIAEDGSIETFNKACEDIFGYAAEDVIGQKVNTLIPDYETLSVQDLNDAANRYELEAQSKTGTRFPIDLSLAVVKIGWRTFYSGVVRDISEKKKAEELGRQITQIFNSSIIEFYIFDVETFAFKFVNESAVKNIGYSEEELLGQRPDSIIPEYADERFSMLVQPLLSGEQERVEYDMTHIRKDGSAYDVVANLQITTFDGSPAFIASMLDITDRNKVTEELKRSNKELENFAYVTSHDLKAPLRHVSMSAGFFKEEYGSKLDDKSNELLDVMIDGVNRMQNMIESLLTYSRVGREGEQFTNINLNEVVLSARQNLSGELSDVKGVVKPGALPVVKADRYLMIQLFQNLIQNSLKYKKENVTPEITIACEEKDGMHLFSVADNGIGIDPMYAEKIFEIFQRLHRDHEYEGVGIGLAICQRIVEFHGGSISLDTTYMNGTKIDFLLPKTRY